MHAERGACRRLFDRGRPKPTDALRSCAVTKIEKNWPWTRRWRVAQDAPAGDRKRSEEGARWALALRGGGEPSPEGLNLAGEVGQTAFGRMALGGEGLELHLKLGQTDPERVITRFTGLGRMLRRTGTSRLRHWRDILAERCIFGNLETHVIR
jgi:hypothetical protein